MAREASRRDLVFGWVRLDPDHEAAISFKGEVPGRRAHSVGGLAYHGPSRDTATSDRDQRPGANARPPAARRTGGGRAIAAPPVYSPSSPASLYWSTQWRSVWRSIAQSFAAACRDQSFARARS